MKIRTLLLLCLLSSFQSIGQQSIGIGTTSPQASSLLDITSTTKGLLIPRMTYTQKNAIPTPATGLMVYQTNTSGGNQSGFYYYDGSIWRRFARFDEIGGGSSSWTINGNNQYSSLTGNVGIGTSTPASKFHVVGSILQEGSTYAINHASGILQFRNNGVNKAYVQLSGQNLRLGTNGGNSAGGVVFRLDGMERMVIDSNGNVGIGTESPRRKFHVFGGIGIIENNGSSILGPLQPLLDFEMTNENNKRGGLRFINGSNILGGVDYTVNTSGPDYLRLTVGASTVRGLTLNSQERVGINMNGSVHDPEAQLHVTAATGIDAIAMHTAVIGESPTIQFYNTVSGGNVGSKKAFLQLNDSNNLRIGTNSGNSTGKLVVRMDGADQAAITPSGRLGLGTVSPIAKLHIVGGDGAGLSSDGYIHLGSVSSANLILDNNEIQARSNGQGSKLYLQRSGGTIDIGGHTTINHGGSGEVLRIDGITPNIGFYHNSSYKSFIAQGTSNLSIGVNGGKLQLDGTQIAIGSINTNAPQYKLTVSGKMICEELKVELYNNWPDYVFAKDYKLTPLHELKSFIETNNHLPNIPTAKEVAREGFEVGEMNRKLLEKVEELTLYVIHLQEQIDQLKGVIRE